MHIEVVTLFPEMFIALQSSITGRACNNKLVTIDFCNPRDFAAGPHHHVDDRPYGGGPGMVLKYEPMLKAIEHAKEKTPDNTKVIYLSPKGKRLEQAMLRQLAQQTSVI